MFESAYERTLMEANLPIDQCVRVRSHYIVSALDMVGSKID